MGHDLIEAALPPSEIAENWQASLYGVVLSEALMSRDAKNASDRIEALQAILLGSLLASFAASALLSLNYQRFPAHALNLLNALYVRRNYELIDKKDWSDLVNRYAPWSWIDEWDRERWLARMFVEVVINVERVEPIKESSVLDPRYACGIRSEMSNVYLSKDTKKRLLRLTEAN